MTWKEGKLAGEDRAKERKKETATGIRGCADPRGRAGRSVRVSGKSGERVPPPHDIKRISRYFGNGQSASSTTNSMASQLVRTASIAGATW